MKRISVEDVKKKCKPSKEDSLYDRTVLRKLSPYLTYLFLLTGLTPNQITILSQIVALVGSMFFLSTSPLYWLLGWCILQIYLLLDDVDGEVARCSGRGSAFGVYFDTITHPFVNALIFVTISFGLYRATNSAFVFLFGFLSACSALFFSVHRWYSAVVKKENRIKEPKQTEFGTGVSKIAQIFTGVGGMIHMILVPAVLDLIVCLLGLKTVSFRYVFLIAVGVAFPLILSRRIYNFKKLLEKR